MPLQGVITALVTPFQGNCIDEEGLSANIQDQITAGVSGLVALGTTGEAPTLTDRECELIINITVAEAKGKLPIIVATGDYCTRSTIANTIRAQELGADYALVVMPYYNRPSQKGLILHIEAIADAVDLPLILYNHPGRTGTNLLPETLAHLSQVHTVVGLKDCTSCTDQVSNYLKVMDRNRFSLFTGNDSFTLPMMALGGHGAISVVSNLVPTQMLALTNAILNGNLAEAQRLHLALMPLFEASCAETNPMPIKEMMQLFGKAAGPCRLPLCSVRQETRKSLIQAMESLNLTFAHQGVCHD